MDNYLVSPELAAIEKMAASFINRGQSIALLLMGPPGGGKTAFAKHIAAQLCGGRLFRYDCNAESNSGLMFSFDVEGVIKREAAFIKGPLWECFSCGAPSVLLLDEVDKSPRDFEAFLLRTLDEQSFRSPKGETVAATAPVVFILTSNKRRELSPELLRRVFRFTVLYPTGQRLRSVVKTMLNDGYNEQLLELCCVVAESMNQSLEGDKVPSPKEIAMCVNTLSVVHDSVEVLFAGFMFKNMDYKEVNQIVKFNIVSRLKTILNNG